MTGSADGSRRQDDAGHGGEGATPADREAAQLAHIVTRRAIRRLDILEWVIILVGAGLCAGGGWLVAWFAQGMVGWDFRSTWIGASLFLFVVAGATAIIQIRRDERSRRNR